MGDYFLGKMPNFEKMQRCWRIFVTFEVKGVL